MSGCDAEDRGAGAVPGRDEATASLVVLSDARSSEQLAVAVGMAPDRAWDRGEPRPKTRTGLRYKSSGIEFRSGLPPSASRGDHIDALLNRLKPNRERIVEVAAALAAEPGARSSVRVWLTHTTTNATPTYYFSRDQVRAICELGAELGVSVWVDDEEVWGEAVDGAL
jgi:hypothetical protein